MAIKAPEPKRERGWIKWRGWTVVVDHFLIRQGQVLPRGYGVAWRQHYRDCSVCMPVPLNVLAGWTRRLWHWLRFGYVKDSMRDAMVGRAYDRGYERGRELGEWRTEQIRHEAYEAGRRDTTAALDGFRAELRELRADIDAP